MSQQLKQEIKNDIGLDGIEFIEFSSPDPKRLEAIFVEFGFSNLKKHKELNLKLFQQGDINFLVNQATGSFAETFFQQHGPCVSAMGWRVKNAKDAFALALRRGAKPAKHSDYKNKLGQLIPAIMGIGDSLIYFIEGGGQHNKNLYEDMGFVEEKNPVKSVPKGFQVIDHLTNNVHQGTMETWSQFYKQIFGFYEVRYFDIRGAKTGLTSYALRSPCGKFCIPINEGTEKKSQINEYLDEYKGPGVQHIALTTSDIVKSLEALRGSSIKMLDIDDEYYQEVFKRVPNVTEDHKKLRDLNILVDGDDEGYLLQIFTKNLIGPIFIEIIQRKNHLSFGEGNFGALFRSIERDQEKRGFI